MSASLWLAELVRKKTPKRLGKAVDRAWGHKRMLRLAAFIFFVGSFTFVFGIILITWFWGFFDRIIVCSLLLAFYYYCFEGWRHLSNALYYPEKKGREKKVVIVDEESNAEERSKVCELVQDQPAQAQDQASEIGAAINTCLGTT